MTIEIDKCPKCGDILTEWDSFDTDGANIRQNWNCSCGAQGFDVYAHARRAVIDWPGMTDDDDYEFIETGDQVRTIAEELLKRSADTADTFHACLPKDLADRLSQALKETAE